MNGHKINDCITILNKLLIPNIVLSSDERKELLNFFVEEKIKSIRIYEVDAYEKTQKVLLSIKEKKQTLIENQQYENSARIRDLEKSYSQAVMMIDELKVNNIKATFAYGLDGLSLIIMDGDYKHAIEELEKFGLHLIFFSKTLERINL